jgi:hypothetical protein
MDDDAADEFEDRVQDEVEERLSDDPDRIIDEGRGQPRSGGCALLLFIPTLAGLWLLA